MLRAETSVSSLPAVIRLALLVPLEGFMEQLDYLPARPQGRIDHHNVRRGLHHFHFVGGLPFCASIPYSMHELLRYASLGALSIVIIRPRPHPRPALLQA